MTQPTSSDVTGQVILVAVYDDEAKAQRAIEQLRDKGAALDMLSVLGRVHASGDDVLGIYYTADPRPRRRVRHVPARTTGQVPMNPAASPHDTDVVILGGGLAGAATGGAMGGAGMAGAAALTHLASVMHHMGIPQDRLDHLHQAIVDGHFVLLLREAADQIQPWLDVIRRSDARDVMELPYKSLVEAL